MFSPEQFCYERVLGVRKEHPTHLAAVVLLVALSKAYGGITGLEVRGSATAKGAVIYIHNHPGEADLFRLMFAAIHAARGENGKLTLGRIPRGLAKSTLFGIPEPAEVRKETGKTDLVNSDHPFVQFLIEHAVGPFLLGNGLIPITRGTNDLNARAEIDHTLKSGQATALSLIGSRDKTGGLKGLRTGAALLLKTYPDIPFQLVGVSRTPHIVTLGKPQTYAAIKTERGNLNFRDLTMLLADGIVELLPESVQERWRLGERETEYQRLYSRRVQAVTPNPSI